MPEKLQSVPGRTKTFYASLDGLRGLAAFAVVFFHLANWTDTVNFVPRGDLAVDFFFCLSGFVMAHAYGDRIGKDYGLRQFALTRLIRLYPMMALSVLVAAAYFLSKFLLSSDEVTLSDVLLASTLGLFVLPYLGESLALSGPLEVFPINGPLWSLFYELLINLAWAAAFAVLTLRRVIGFGVACAALLLVAGLAHGDLLLGDRTVDFFWGIPRVGVSFAAGLIVYAMHKKSLFRVRIPFWGVAL
ncbi:MAG: acyltransferase, partial [Pseudomonadota bacterium]